jgi:hypothetical protein
MNWDEVGSFLFWAWRWQMSMAVRGKRFVARVQQAVEKLRESGDLSPFTELLPMETIQRVLDQVGWVFRERIYTPLLCTTSARLWRRQAAHRG